MTLQTLISFVALFISVQADTDKTLYNNFHKKRSLESQCELNKQSVIEGIYVSLL